MDMSVKARNREQNVEAHNVCQQGMHWTSTQHPTKRKQLGRTNPFQRE